MAKNADAEPAVTGSLELHACLAATGQHLALLLLPATGTVGSLCQAVLEERRDQEHAACSFHAFLGGRFLDASQPLLSLGLHNGAVVDLVRCRPLSVLTVASDGTAKVFSTETGMCTLTLPGRPRSAASGAFSPDGERAVILSRPGPAAKLQKVATGQHLLWLKGHTGPLNTAAFSPEGYHVATASADRTARLWNARTGECLRVLEGHRGEVLDAAFAPDGHHVLTASQDGTAKLWSAAAGACVRTLVGHKWAVNSARFSHDAGHIVTTSDDRTAKVWSAETGACMRTLEGHKSPVVEAAFSGCWDSKTSRRGSDSEGL